MKKTFSTASVWPLLSTSNSFCAMGTVSKTALPRVARKSVRSSEATSSDLITPDTWPSRPVDEAANSERVMSSAIVVLPISGTAPMGLAFSMPTSASFEYIFWPRSRTIFCSRSALSFLTSSSCCFFSSLSSLLKDLILGSMSSRERRRDSAEFFSASSMAESSNSSWMLRMMRDSSSHLRTSSTNERL